MNVKNMQSVSIAYKQTQFFLSNDLRLNQMPVFSQKQQTYFLVCQNDCKQSVSALLNFLREILVY